MIKTQYKANIIKYPMKLITKQVEKVFEKYPLYSQDGKGKMAKVNAHFFFGAFDFYALEGQKDGNDFIMYGITIMNGETEYGYQSANELTKVKFLGYPCIEREYGWKPTPAKDIDKLKEFLDNLYPDC